MPTDIEGEAPGPWYKRLGWFIALWAAGVLTVGTVAYIIRLWIA